MLSNTMTRRIEWGDCDPAGIVYNPNFLSYFDHGTALLYEAAGWTRREMIAEFGVSGCPLVATRAEFKVPCEAGEDVQITSTVTRIGTSSFDVHHQLHRDGVLCVEGFETRVWTVRDDAGKLVSRPIPEAMAAKLRGD